MSRDYSAGNLRDLIAAAETLEELEQVRELVVRLAAQGQIASGTLRKLERAGGARFRELDSRVIVAPGGGRRTRSGLYLP